MQRNDLHSANTDKYLLKEKWGCNLVLISG